MLIAILAMVTPSKSLIQTQEEKNQSYSQDAIRKKNKNQPCLLVNVATN